jgi:hypothetical protein
MSEFLRWYPVVLEFTQHKVTYVKAESDADAVQQVKQAVADGPGEIWESADDLDVLDGISVSDGSTARLLVDSTVIGDCGQIGPREACPECGCVARYTYDWALEHADHAGTCSRHQHRVDVDWVYSGRGDRKVVGYRASCSCGAHDLERLYGEKGELENLGDRTVYVTREEAGEVARAHVVDKPHAKNIPLGVMKDAEHPDYRGRLVEVKP